MTALASSFLAEIERASSVLIGTHVNPDGDALGSALAVAAFLEQRGIECEVVSHHPAPYNLEFLPGVRKVRQTPKHDKHDLGIIVDLDALERLGSLEETFSQLPRLIVVDHHVPHAAPGDLRIVDQKAAATAAILAELFFELGVDVTPDMATCLLTGIVTDTGSFRFRNTDVKSLMLAAKLLEAGGDINRISEEVFQRKPLASMRLLGFLLERMSLEANERVAWGALSLQDFEIAHAKDEDTEGFVNELLSIRTVQLAALFREPKRGKVRLSLRSRGDIDVAALAREFGGGGHRNAAGCSFDGELDEVLSQVVPRLTQCLASS